MRRSPPKFTQFQARAWPQTHAPDLWESERGGNPQAGTSKKPRKEGGETGGKKKGGEEGGGGGGGGRGHPREASPGAWALRIMSRGDAGSFWMHLA